MTIVPQNFDGNISTTFDTEQPVESQILEHDNLADSITEGQGEAMCKSARLSWLEMAQNRLSYQRLLITKAQRRLDDDISCGTNAFCETPLKSGDAESMPLLSNQLYNQNGVTLSLPEQTQLEQLERVSSTLQDRELSALDRLSQARICEVRAKGGSRYLDFVDKGDFKSVCVVCRACREMRSHHCKECRRCVSRLDHHCPWIDNCVGLANQRIFFFFIMVLLLTILYFYNVIFHYLVQVYFFAKPGSSWGSLVKFLWQSSIAEKLSPIIVLLLAAGDLLWLAFFSALVLRHTVYICNNVTTYEAIVRPPHVQKRFRQCHSSFWFLQGCGLVKSYRNCVNYWTLRTDEDMKDFHVHACESGLVLGSEESTSNSYAHHYTHKNALDSLTVT